MAEETNHEPTPENFLDPTFLVDDSTKQFFDEYVGPGKKYPNVGELAKAYANADKHIHELTKDTGKYKTEAETLRELLMENLVNEKEPKPNDEGVTPPNDAAPNHEPGSNEAPPKDNVDIKALVKEALGEVSSEEQKAKNARIAEEATIKKFGDQQAALKAVSDRAAELGISPQWIANLAFESPKAYFATMGFQPDETPKSNNTPSSSSDVNPQAVRDTNPNGPTPNTYKWFMEIRRTDPVKFRSAAVQTALMKQAQENPDFYK